MKRIYSFLFAILTLAATTGVFTSCQEDAPEIDYTINITVNNDFTEVIDAINNGTMKQEAAIAALTAAINGMTGSDPVKLDALIEAINKLASTIDAKLAILEAAMKAQTLAFEAKLDLLTAAVKALPNYTDQLKAIEAAIKGMPDYSKQLEAISAAVEAIPDYSDKLGLLETALKAIADNIKAQEGQYADELAALTDAIDAIKSEVAAGNLSQKDALAQIIALLESGAIAGGGGGSGSGGEGSGGEGSGGEGSGGEGSGGEDSGLYYISFTTENPVLTTIQFACIGEVKSISGVKDLKNVGTLYGSPLYEATLIGQEVTVYGKFTEFLCDDMKLTKINTDTQSSLERIYLRKNSDLEFNFKLNTKLEVIDLKGVDITKEELPGLVEQFTVGVSGLCYISFTGDESETSGARVAATDKGWYLAIEYI